jgi:hypothetical protein
MHVCGVRVFCEILSHYIMCKVNLGPSLPEMSVLLKYITLYGQKRKVWMAGMHTYTETTGAVGGKL